MQAQIEAWKRRAASTSPRGQGEGRAIGGKENWLREDCVLRSTARFNFLGLGKESSVCRDDHSTEIVSNFLASTVLHAWAP
jgi:hypothetical protein